MIKGPLMLEIGILPPVASMVAATMVLYTSATATVVYALFDLIELDFAAFFFLWAMLWTAAGQAVLDIFLKRYHMASFIVLAIGLTIILSVLVYVSHAVRQFVLDPASALTVPNFCPVSE